MDHEFIVKPDPVTMILLTKFQNVVSCEDKDHLPFLVCFVK